MRPGATSIVYRVATYIVISKPKRMSWKDGLDHCICDLLELSHAPLALCENSLVVDDSYMGTSVCYVTPSQTAPKLAFGLVQPSRMRQHGFAWRQPDKITW